MTRDQARDIIANALPNETDHRFIVDLAIALDALGILPNGSQTFSFGHDHGNTTPTVAPGNVTLTAEPGSFGLTTPKT